MRRLQTQISADFAPDISEEDAEELNDPDESHPLAKCQSDVNKDSQKAIFGQLLQCCSLKGSRIGTF